MHAVTFDATTRGLACQLAAAGLNRKQVAQRLGCSPRTLRRALGKNCDFAELFRQAEARTLAHPLESLRRHARTNWRAAAWLLERTRPRRFAQRRPALCRPRELDLVGRLLMELALREIPDRMQASQVAEDMVHVLDEAARALTDPHSPSWAVLRRHTPLADLEYAMIEARRARLEDDGAEGLIAAQSGLSADKTVAQGDKKRTERDTFCPPDSQNPHANAARAA